MDENWDDDDTMAQPVGQKNYERRDHRRGHRDVGSSQSYRSKEYRSHNNRTNDRNMYRSNDYHGSSDGGSRHKFNAQLSMEISRNSVGKVIGKGGSNIREIQTKFSVHVNVQNSDSNEIATVLVKGYDMKNVEETVNYIKDQCDESKQNSSRDRRKYENEYEDYGSNNDYSNNYENHFDNRPPSPEEKPFVPIDWENLNKMAEEERIKKWSKCPKMIKNFYDEDPEVAALSSKDVSRIREENNSISVGRIFRKNDTDDEYVPNPVWKFEQCFAKYPDLLEEIRKQSFEKPSPIQSQAWPILLKGEDMIGIAQTGTGKTLAFLLPAMIHTEFQPQPRRDRAGPNVLVLAPTRELALQIEKEVGKYSFRGMKAVCVYGGGDRKEQINVVSKGVEIVIATPGRLNDLVQAGKLNISTITYLVLDEADRMLDMGFEPQIRKLLIDIRPDRQTIMTSATWPPGVRRLAQSYMNNPIQVCVGSLDLAAVHTVNQIVEIIDEHDKFFRIMDFIKDMDSSDKAIIFCGRKARADDLSSELTLKGILCQCIHGSRDQNDREQAIADITSGEVKILIATDVASRGLDIEDITYVVNFDFPRNIEEYVHRVGRTGRAGKRGTSISLLTREDWGSANELISILEEANQEVPDELHEMANRFKVMKERRAKEAASFGCDNRRRGGSGGGSGGSRKRY